MSAVVKHAEISPMPLLNVAAGFMASKYLFVASELRVFEALANGPMRLTELADAVRLEPKRLRVLLDALVALELIERKEERFQNAAVASAFVAGVSGLDLRPLLYFWSNLNYPLWTKLKNSVRSGRGFGSFCLNSEEQRVYSNGVAACSALDAAALPEACPLQHYGAVLDLGGGNGTWLEPLLDRWAHLRGTLFELPSAAAIARERLCERIREARVSIVEGDFFEDILPAGHDVVVVANIVHGFAPEANRRLLRRLRVQLGEGTRLLLVDLWRGVSQSQSQLATLMAGGFLISTGEGMAYSAEEVAEWLRETGWSFIECRPLPFITSVIVADASA